MSDGRGNGDGDRISGLTGGTDEVSALVGNRVPIPLEELDDYLCWEKRKGRRGMEGRNRTDLCQRLAWEQVRPRREKLEKRERGIWTLIGITNVVRNPKRNINDLVVLGGNGDVALMLYIPS